MAGDNNPVLELYLYRGGWQLATLDALYSDGDRYAPLVRAFKEVKPRLAAVKSVLVMGTGLGSAVHIFRRMGYHARFTLVDYDAVILKLAMELMPDEQSKDINPICADARNFIAGHNEQYDMLIVDIFESRVVPAFVTENSFLQKCHQCISTGGIFIMNYMENKDGRWATLKENLDKIFPTNKIIEQGLNRIIIATV
jgi:spermidine synthase